MLHTVECNFSLNLNLLLTIKAYNLIFVYNIMKNKMY